MSIEELHRCVIKIEECAINEIIIPDQILQLYGPNGVKEYKDKLINMVLAEIKNLSQDRQRYELTKLLFYDKNNYQLFYLIANTFLSENKINEAKSYYTISINLNKSYIPAYFGLANIYKITGRKDLGIMLLEHLYHIVSFEDSESVVLVLKNYYDDPRSIEKLFLTDIVSSNNKMKSLYNLALVVKDNNRANKCLDECIELADSEHIKNLIRSKRRT